MEDDSIFLKEKKLKNTATKNKQNKSKCFSVQLEILNIKDLGFKFVFKILVRKIFWLEKFKSEKNWDFFYRFHLVGSN